MKLKRYYIAILLLLFYGCSENMALESLEKSEHDNTSGEVAIQIGFSQSNNPASRNANSNPSNEITEDQIIDSLIKDLRILIFDSITKECEGVADFAPIRLSQIETLNVICDTGRKDFVFLTNVCSGSVMSSSLIGLQKKEILIGLDKFGIGEGDLYSGARQYFKGEVNHILVKKEEITTVNVELKRVVSQLETSIKYNHIIDTANSQIIPKDYIYRMRSIAIWFTSPNINLLHKIDTLASDSSVIADTLWNHAPIDTTFCNTVRLFPTDSIDTHTAVLFAAEININHSKFKANPADLIMPNGKAIRYWWIQIKNNKLSPNKRLKLNIKSLIGFGSPYLPAHKPENDAVFTIEVQDWISPPDRESGTHEDFYK